MSDEKIESRFRGQHGVVSRAQALEAGLTDRQIDRRVASGRWVRVRRGVYRHAAVRPTWKGNLLGACLATGGLASHRAAAYLHGIDGFRAVQLEVVVAHGRWRQLPGVRLHQTTQIERAGPIDRDKIPCTGLARTLIDLGAVVSMRRMESAFDCVLREGKLEIPALYANLISHARRGRDGCGPYREVLEARGGEERVPLSDWSRMVSELLVDHGLAEPVLEHRIRDRNGRFLGQADLAYPHDRVVIELDSIRWHLNRESFEGDRRRWNRFVIAGWTALAFSWADFVDRPLDLVSDVATALTRS